MVWVCGVARNTTHVYETVLLDFIMIRNGFLTNGQYHTVWWIISGPRVVHLLSSKQLLTKHTLKKEYKTDAIYLSLENLFTGLMCRLVILRGSNAQFFCLLTDLRLYTVTILVQSSLKQIQVTINYLAPSRSINAAFLLTDEVMTILLLFYFTREK